MAHDISNLFFFQGYSLVDITATGMVRSTNDETADRHQQRNWETVLQCMGLRTQPQHIQKPRINEIELDRLQFGDFYSGVHRVWTWSWAVEGAGVYDLPGKPLGGLQQDFEQVPIITYLEETARFMLPIFYPYGTIRNIYFQQLITPA